MTAANSAGLTHVAKSASAMSARLAGVSMIDGMTALTVRAVDLVSSARDSVSLCTPALDAA